VQGCLHALSKHGWQQHLAPWRSTWPSSISCVAAATSTGPYDIWTRMLREALSQLLRQKWETRLPPDLKASSDREAACTVMPSVDAYRASRSPVA
jgi:hypothetical protein